MGSTYGLHHIVIASHQVATITAFFSKVFAKEPDFQNDEFSDFAFENGTRVAFFAPIGKSARFFSAEGVRSAVAHGISLRGVDACYERCVQLEQHYSLELSGPPKDHPWGERSFLVVDPDGNRWEVMEAPRLGSDNL